MMGSLIHFISDSELARSSKQKNSFQPMPPNFGILPELSRRIRDKRYRYGAYRDRALQDILITQRSIAESN